jgi:hypothetical protein
LRGATYSEIAAEGGGILTTMKATRTASIDELVENGKKLAIIISAMLFHIPPLDYNLPFRVNKKIYIAMCLIIAIIKLQQFGNSHLNFFNQSIQRATFKH